MLQVSFCKPTLLYQNMLLLLMPDIDFRLNLIPPPPRKKTSQSGEENKPKTETRIIRGIMTKLMVSRALKSEFVMLVDERICDRRASKGS